jgi:hypothetical protein
MPQFINTPDGEALVALPKKEFEMLHSNLILIDNMRIVCIMRMLYICSSYFLI